MIRIKQADLKKIRKVLLDKQGWICPLCQRELKYVQPRQRCVDHDHKKGYIREVLCANCNGNEGRVLRRVEVSKHNITVLEWLENLVAYWKKHITPQTEWIHHTWKTEDEKRLLRNKKARMARAKKKGK